MSLKPEGTLCEQLVRPLCNRSSGYSFVLRSCFRCNCCSSVRTVDGADFLFGRRLHLSTRTPTICFSKKRHDQNHSATQKGRSTAMQEWQ